MTALPLHISTWRILIVDDDVSMANALQRLLILEKMYTVRVLNEGSNINQKIREWEPHLVVIDVKMRGIDGFDVCSQIRQEPKNDKIRIIAISGTVDEADAKKMLEIGADAYFEKPFNNKELCMEIIRLLTAEHL